MLYYLVELWKKYKSEDRSRRFHVSPPTVLIGEIHFSKPHKHIYTYEFIYTVLKNHKIKSSQKSARSFYIFVYFILIAHYHP